MEEYDTFTKSSPKIRDLLEKRFQVDLSRFNEDMIFYHYKCFKNVLNSIVTENKNPSTFEYESSCNVFKEIFKMTPLKKRPVRPQPTTSYESPASTEIKYVPEHRLSKRKKLKPTKKIIASRAEVPKFDTGAICVPVIKMHTETTSAPANREDSVTETGTEVMVLPLKMESASVPEKPRKPRKNSTPKKRGPQNIKRKMTRQELEDYKLAKTLQAADFNLRERISKRIIQQTISPKIEPVEMSATSTERRKSRKYGLSPELANIIGRKEMRPDKIAEKMYMILKKRNLLSGNGRSVNCDMDLSKKLFSGKRHFPVSDIMGLLRKHMIYVV